MTMTGYKESKGSMGYTGRQAPFTMGTPVIGEINMVDGDFCFCLDQSPLASLSLLQWQFFDNSLSSFHFPIPPKRSLVKRGGRGGRGRNGWGGGWRGVTTKFLLASFCSHRNLVREPLHGRPGLASFVHTLGITLLLPWPLKVIVILMTSHRYVKTLGLAYECF